MSLLPLAASSTQYTSCPFNCTLCPADATFLFVLFFFFLHGFGFLPPAGFLLTRFETKPFDGVEKVLLGIFGVICIVNLLARPSKRTFKNTTSLFAKAFGGFFFAQWLATRYLADVAAPQSLEFWAICGVVGVLMAVAAGSREPAKLTAFGGAFGAHAAAWATGQPLLYFYSLAFLFQLSQGVSHRISGEQATLLQLNDSTNKKVVSHEQDRRRLGFEWAHVVYFPALLMQSLNQSTLGI